MAAYDHTVAAYRQTVLTAIGEVEWITGAACSRELAVQIGRQYRRRKRHSRSR